MPPVRKAIIPAAGFGTRFLPIAKAVPKEMLPIVDRPVIDYVVEEAAASGITDILIVISRDKRAIEEFFHSHPSLEAALRSKGKSAELEIVSAPNHRARLHFTWQQEMLGLGDAVLLGRTFAGNDPCAVLLGDTIVTSSDPANPVTAQLCAAFNAQGGSAVALEEVPEDKVSRYGIADASPIGDRTWRVHQWVEKPSRESAPSRMAIASRYVFSPAIFDCLAATPKGLGGEIQLTDAMRLLVSREPMFGVQFNGTRHDIGNPAGFIKANLEFALQRPEMADSIRRTIADLSGS